MCCEFRAICYFLDCQPRSGQPDDPACFDNRQRAVTRENVSQDMTGMLVDDIINACDALKKGETKTVTPRRSPLVRRYMTQLIGARGAQRGALQGAPPTPSCRYPQYRKRHAPGSLNLRDRHRINGCHRDLLAEQQLKRGGRDSSLSLKH